MRHVVCAEPTGAIRFKGERRLIFVFGGNEFPGGDCLDIGIVDDMSLWNLGYQVQQFWLLSERIARSRSIRLRMLK